LIYHVITRDVQVQVTHLRMLNAFKNNFAGIYKVVQMHSARPLQVLVSIRSCNKTRRSASGRIRSPQLVYHLPTDYTSTMKQTILILATSQPTTCAI